MIWVDAQLSPALARWITSEFNLPAKTLRAALPKALAMIDRGEPLVEITGAD